jgi:hypothetical protein
MAPAKIAQLALVFLMVILIVNPTPVLSLTIFAVTNDEGDLVGNGPAVSVEVTVQVVEVEPPVLVAVVVSVATDEELLLSLLQALITGMVNAPNPANPNPLKNSFLSIMVYFKVTVIKVFKPLKTIKFMR